MAQPVQVSAPPTDAALPGAASHGINRDTNNDRETGNKCSPTRSGRLCLSDSLGLQNGWWLTPGPVVNLKPLNKFVAEEHFKVEGFHMVKDLVNSGDWLTKLDLKDV